jgi:hypothetical protein
VATVKIPNSAPEYVVPADNAVQTPRPTFLKGSGWSLSVPVEFDLKVTPNNPQRMGALTNEFVAVSKDKHGRGPMVLNVSVIDLVAAEMSAATFPLLVIETMRMDEDVKVLKEGTFELGGHKGTLVATVNPAGVLIFQLALATGNSGFLFRCGGDVMVAGEVSDTCAKVFGTFKLTK